MTQRSLEGVQSGPQVSASGQKIGTSKIQQGNANDGRCVADLGSPYIY